MLKLYLAPLVPQRATHNKSQFSRTNAICICLPMQSLIAMVQYNLDQLDWKFIEICGMKNGIGNLEGTQLCVYL